MQTEHAVSIECADHVNLFVHDLRESVDFYTRLFGTDGEIKDRGHAKGLDWCIIGIPQKFYFCLYELPNAPAFDADAMHINHVGFYVRDFDETCRRVEQLGLPIRYGGRPVTWHHRGGASRSLYVVDPNGYTIEFAERLGGGLD